jgi:hypothetical protein
LKTKAKIIFAANSLGLIALLVAGIILFYLRSERWSQTIAHDMSIKAQQTRQLILKNQFLIFIPKAPADLTTILDRLGLELSMPLLNWALVTKKNYSETTPISLESPEAYEDRLVLKSLLEHPHIIDAQHNFVLDSALRPQNNFFSHEWQLEQSSPKNSVGLNLPAAWDITLGDNKNYIAVVDEFLVNDQFAFLDRFPECNERIDFVRPFRELHATQESHNIPHGEIMLLALGACNTSKLYSTGIDWKTKILAVQRPSCGQAQTFLAALTASAIDVCTQSSLACPAQAPAFIATPRPQVLLLPFASDAPDLLQFSSDMIKAISEENIIVVTAAGNNNQEASNFFPGGTPGVINVGAVNQQGERASFSNWGPSIDFLAPGDSLHFLYATGRKRAQGTSIAAAYAAGTISLMKALNPNLSIAQARYLLHSSAHVLGCDNYCAHAYNSENQAPCHDICCEDGPDICGKRVLDTYEALLKTQKNTINSPVLALDNHYVIFLRSSVGFKQITVSNQGDNLAHVEAMIFDDNLEISPQNFVLEPRAQEHNSQILKISFKKEPFKRTMFKVRLLAKEDTKIVDWSDVYIEYAPKK